MPSATTESLTVLIIGAGLGGLSCAIACRREGLETVVLEQAKTMSEIGAGIQMPSNAVRIMDHYGLLKELVNEGQAMCLEYLQAKRYSDGKVLTTRPGEDWSNQHFGYPSYVMHRADYQQILYHEALRLGADIRLNHAVKEINPCTSHPSAILTNGTQITASVIIGADGLSSIVRPTIVQSPTPAPIPSGDMAYRATITASQAQNLSPSATALLSHPSSTTWWGPNSHVVLYALRGGAVWNLVLVRPDDLPENIDRTSASIADMNAQFQNWDPILRAVIANVNTCDKWRIRTMEELPRWSRGNVTLLGDACHPTLPYQAQGAAMAVEDGAVLGRLLGLCSRNAKADVGQVLSMYEVLRKDRTTLNVQGADENRDLYHMDDEEVRRTGRDELLAELDWDNDVDSKFPWTWGRLDYLTPLLSCDVVAEAEKSFEDAFGGQSRGDGHVHTVATQEVSPSKPQWGFDSSWATVWYRCYSTIMTSFGE